MGPIPPPRFHLNSYEKGKRLTFPFFEKKKKEKKLLEVKPSTCKCKNR